MYKLSLYEKSFSDFVKEVCGPLDKASQAFAMMKRYDDYKDFDIYLPASVYRAIRNKCFYEKVSGNSDFLESWDSYICDNDISFNCIFTLVKRAIKRAYGLNYNEMIYYYYMRNGLPLELANRREVKHS